MSDRLLFITSTRIGDAVLTSGLLSYLIEEMNGPLVTVACGPVAAPLFAGVPNLERLIAMPKKKRAGHWLSLWSQVVGTAWHTVVDLRGSAIAWTLPLVQRRLVPGKAPEHLHRVQAAATVIGREANPPLPHLWTLPHHRATAAAVVPDDDFILALGPAANWRAKTWRAENFAELARRLTAEDGPLPRGKVVVIAGPGEEAQAAPVLAAVPEHRRISLVGANDLLTVAACLQRCSLFVGNDSGLMHMAAAMGTPTVGLFGPSRVDHFGPCGLRTAVVQTTVPYAELMPPGVDLRDSDSLMDSITVDMVQHTAQDLLWGPEHG
ncbi:glycosyltransferase family 9 protein [Insolitispirillum peregrinum]|uniref:glycosyltransferase family 9 protein n=1 Tax=Insolitispirillum peregrinum TaxID=80876 RepID=UPI00361FCB73